jgi:hypothetical protein
MMRALVVSTAAFDTRFDKPRWLVVSAARAAKKRLRQLGFDVLAPSESFYVKATSGPLLDGERERALEWGRELGTRLLARGPRRAATD